MVGWAVRAPSVRGLARAERAQHSRANVGLALGDKVGAQEKGAKVGRNVGTLVGGFVGASLGASVGASVGASEGDAVGTTAVGSLVGAIVGSFVGEAVVGTSDGDAVGVSLGDAEGAFVGELEGAAVVGTRVGASVAAVGRMVGAAVGFFVLLEPPLAGADEPAAEGLAVGRVVPEPPEKSACRVLTGPAKAAADEDEHAAGKHVRA
jgi:hypothetical protein